MKVITPIDIAGVNMDSSIAQPDGILGEVEWVDRGGASLISSSFIDTDTSGNDVWGLAQGGGSAVLIDPTTGSTGATVSFAGYVGSSIAVIPTGFLLLQGNFISSFTSSGAFSFSVDVSGIAPNPNCITSGGSDFVYVSSSLNGNIAVLTSVIVYSRNIGTGYSGVNKVNLLDGGVLAINPLNSNTYFTWYNAGTQTGFDFDFSTTSSNTFGISELGSSTYIFSSLRDVSEYDSSSRKFIGLWFEGDKAIPPSSNSIYYCASDNSDNPELGAAKTPPTWIEVGPTNKYAAFDYAINTKATLDIATAEYTFAPSEICTTISLYGMERVTRVYVEVREDNASGAIIYSEQQDTAISSPFEDLIANEAFLTDKVIFDDLPVYATPFITVTFESDDSTILIGDIVIGNARSLGVVNYQSSTSRTSYDTVNTDIFGNEKITSRPSAEYTSFELTVDAVYADYVERILKDSLNKPRVWIGEKSGGEKLFTFGYYERSPIVYSSPTKYDTNLKVRGLV